MGLKSALSQATAKPLQGHSTPRCGKLQWRNPATKRGSHTHYSTPLKVKGRKWLSSTVENAALAGVTCYGLVLVLALVLEMIQDKGLCSQGASSFQAQGAMDECVILRKPQMGRVMGRSNSTWENPGRLHGRGVIWKHK